MGEYAFSFAQLGGVKLYDNTLGADTTSVDWTGIPTGFATLLITGKLRSTTTGNTANLGFRFNGDSGTNYGLQYHSMSNATVSGSSSNGNSSNLITVVGASGDSSAYSRFNVFLFDYADTSTKKVGGGHVLTFPIYGTTSTYRVDSFAWVWNSTAAINELTWIDSSGNKLTSGSRIVVYGIA